MGLRRIEEKITQEAALKVKGSQLALQHLEDMSKKVRNLHKELQEMEKKYKSDIKKNSNLAETLMKLRQELGLPLALGIYDVGEKPSIKDRLRGKDDYVNYLALRVLELGKQNRSRTGGILSVSELILQLNDEKKGITISIKDINDAIQLLKENNLIHKVRTLAGIRIVEFNDPNLSNDHQILLELAAKANGQISLTEIVQKTSWTLERVERTVEALINQKIAVRSKTLDGVIISFPGI
ncbi:MAG: hypothetical protein ACW97P_05265 [Candidatus Hodarchaeales archaeon]|jgi:regulator of replication initiation timing